VKAAPAFSQNRIFVAAYGGTVTALRAGRGRVIWRSGTSGRSFGRAGNFYGTPAVAFGRLYATNTDGRVYSFGASNGRLAWSHTIGGYVYAAPAVADVDGLPPAVFTGSYSGRFVALDARSGRQLWSHSGPSKISGAPSVIGRTVYYSSLAARRTYALSARSGRVIWSLGKGAFNPAISDGKRVYITGYSTIYAFESRDAAKKRAAALKKKRAALKKKRAAQRKKKRKKKS
jgi:outer membrane protein assembly factor BamB